MTPHTNTLSVNSEPYEHLLLSSLPDLSSERSIGELATTIGAEVLVSSLEISNKFATPDAIDPQPAVVALHELLQDETTRLMWFTIG